MALQPILIIEDDFEDRFLIEIAFKELGLEDNISFAEDGQKAIDVLQATTTGNSKLPKLLVLDLNMPKMSGTEMLKIIKQHDVLKNIPVTVFSTSISDWDKAECLKYGVTSYVTKPVTFNEFLDTARSFHQLAVA